MNADRVYEEWKQEMLREGLQQGLQQGLRQEQRLMVESLLRARFGELDEELLQLVEPLLALPREELAHAILERSRAELLELCRPKPAS